jgi:hypothetical protein
VAVDGLVDLTLVLDLPTGIALLLDGEFGLRKVLFAATALYLLRKWDAF